MSLGDNIHNLVVAGRLPDSWLSGLIFAERVTESHSIAAAEYYFFQCSVDFTATTDRDFYQGFHDYIRHYRERLSKVDSDKKLR